ncbi:MAG: hypothetical protein M1502_02415 [Deltaproteobacteria bacterium]|nr:hypothetical protein [Deltaproteobacteria bacterium]
MNKNKTYIGIKIVNGTVYGVERQTGKSKSGKQVYFEELRLSEQDAKVLKTALPVYRKIFFILPPEIVSFKILTYPFKLKGASNIEMLAKTAIEELTPLKVKELIVSKHKLSDHTLLVEYAKKETVSGLINKYNLGDLNGLRIYFPFSVLCKTGKRFYSEDGADCLLKYDFLDKSYAVIYKKGKVAEIIDLKLNNEYDDEFKNNDTKAATNIIDLNSKAREIFSGMKDFYSDLIFLMDNECKQENFLGIFIKMLNNSKDSSVLEYFKISDIIGDGSVSAFYVNKSASYAALAAGLVLIFICVGLIEENYYKSAEKTAISKKINLILEKYIPGQKVFYEPRYEIKSYYDKIKGNYGGGNDAFLSFLKYSSEEKGNIKSLKIESISYSFKKFDFKGSISGYNNLHKLEIYLKKRYSAVNVIKSYKNSNGNIKFDIALK